MNISTILLAIVIWIGLGVLVWDRFIRRFRPKDKGIMPIAVVLWPGVLIYWIIVESILDEF